MCWPEHPATKGARRVGWGEGAEKVDTPPTARLKWTGFGLLTNTPILFRTFFSFYSSILSFSLPLKQGRIDFLTPPPFLLFNTPLPLPTPHSPNQYCICMYIGIQYMPILKPASSCSSPSLPISPPIVHSVAVFPPPSPLIYSLSTPTLIISSCLRASSLSSLPPFHRC